MYLLLLFPPLLLEVNAMYYIQQFHQQPILLFFDILLPHFVLLGQIYHLIHLYDILMYLNHLVQLIHNCLNFLFLIVEILLYCRQENQTSYQNVPMLVLTKLALHMSILLNYLHCSKVLSFSLLIMFAQHQRLLLHNVVTISTQLNILFFIILINFIF